MTKTSLKPFTSSYRVRFKLIARSASGSRITGEQINTLEQKSKVNHKRPTKDDQVIQQVFILHRFYPNCGSTDGEWFVCMDNIFKDVKRNKCVVYSFGLADDITFENELSDLGCTGILAVSKKTNGEREYQMLESMYR